MTSRIRSAAILLASVATAVTALAQPAAAADPSPGGWTGGDHFHVDSLTGGEGLASAPDGSLLYRGLASVPLSLRDKGWNHIGDPDISDGGYVFDAYQSDGTTSKLFTVTTPDGQRYEYEHTLDSGEAHNNSFATVSPDNQWLVSGEWGDENRLQVFPAPLLNPSTPPTGGALPQAGQISLDRTVNNVQGCDFVSGTRLVCVSDDATKDLLQVDLPHALDGSPVTGTVTTLLQLPQDSICSGDFEAEGVDYDPRSRTLRAEVVPPGICKAATRVYEYSPTTG
ncbi:hypothetical protein ACWC4D_34080 [Streptomyces sp. NPDC001288]|uniref:hypothetical protein n=1 Tax=unclassified Streptomyces TaxID=2593676 RepID=UPI0033209C39